MASDAALRSGKFGPIEAECFADLANRTRVEVLNGSGVPGVAAEATELLRASGLDVVYFGNASESGLDSTRIIVRRGSQSAGERVRAALGVGRVEVDLDSARLLDVSVLLGADFAARAARSLDFHP